MSLGPVGASLDPDQVENFEDVRLTPYLFGSSAKNDRWKNNSLSKVSTLRATVLFYYVCSPITSVSLNEAKDSCATHVHILGSS